VQTERLYQERLKRILDAVALEKPDRVPVVLEYAGFAAYVTGTRMAEFLRCPETNLDTMIRAFDMVGDADAINYGSFWPYNLCFSYMSKIAVPGVDLPEDEMWQVVESELMTRDDYDQILKQGWTEYAEAFLSQRILHDVPDDYLPPRRKAPDAQKAWRQKGVPVLSGGDAVSGHPGQCLCLLYSLDPGARPPGLYPAVRMRHTRQRQTGECASHGCRCN
jgi:hypothetical protein